MTDVLHPQAEDEASDDPTPVPMRVARIWKKNRPPNEGSLSISLKAMDVLYDAGEPLSREEIATRLVASLDPYEQAYLKAWDRHDRQSQRDRQLRRTNKPTPNVFDPDDLGSNIEQSTHRWITRVFLARLRSRGHTLERLADGRLRPGSGSPVVLQMDGSLARYTAETRHALAQEEQAKHRHYLVNLELSELFQRLPLSDQVARAQLLYLLVRRLLIGFKTDGQKFPLDERIVSPQLNRLVNLAETADLQKAILQRALDAIWTAPETKP